MDIDSRLDAYKEKIDKHYEKVKQDEIERLKKEIKDVEEGRKKIVVPEKQTKELLDSLKNIPIAKYLN